jgi:hypothetical protein
MVAPIVVRIIVCTPYATATNSRYCWLAARQQRQEARAKQLHNEIEI